MNKKLKNFFTEQGMTVEGNRAYGIVRGYEVNAAYNTNVSGAIGAGAFGVLGAAMYSDLSSPLKIHFSFYATDEQKKKMDEVIKSVGFKNCKHDFTAFGLVIGLTAMTFGKLAEMLPQIMDTFLSVLSGNGALGSEYCPTCGEPLGEDGKKCNINGYSVTLKESCVADMNAEIDADNEAFKAAPNNYLRGFMGALTGALAGAALAAVILLFGFISAWSAVVSVLLGSFLYVKFGGKPTKMMLVIVSITTVVLMALTVFLIYYLTGTELSGMFYLDLALVLIFSAIGIGVQAFSTAQKIKRRKNIK